MVSYLSFFSSNQSICISYILQIALFFSAIVDKLENKYGEAVYNANGRPRVASVRFNFSAEKENAASIASVSTVVNVKTVTVEPVAKV